MLLARRQTITERKTLVSAYGYPHQKWLKNR